MASIFSSENRIVARIAAQGTTAISDSANGVDIRSLFKEMDIRLEETFHFTREQLVSLKLTVLILEPDSDFAYFEDKYLSSVSRHNPQPKIISIQRTSH